MSAQLMGFEYLPLEDAARDIRLISVQPGAANDAIRLKLWHVPLGEPPPIESTDRDRATAVAVQKALPPGWVAVQTPEGRWLFEDEATERTSWVHPDPTFDQSLLQAASRVPDGLQVPSYEALSYLWGGIDTSETVQVQYCSSDTNGILAGHDHSSALLKIGRNLFVALHHLRYAGRARILWVDAICINQADEVEKSKQIVRMAALYQLAQRVVIWLGPASEESQAKEERSSTLALSKLAHIGAQVELSRATVRFAAPMATEDGWFRSACPIPYPLSVWTAIEQLLGRQYFQRLWIVQEVLLATESSIVVCGHDEMRLYHFIRAIVCLVTKDAFPLPLRRLLESIRILAWRHIDFSVPFVLDLLRQRQCHSSYDRIYGALGVTPSRFNTMLREPNYKLPLAEVYKNAFITCVKMEQRLTLLMHCELTSPMGQTGVKTQDLPSWVPNWSAPRITHPLSAFVSASGSSRAWWRLVNKRKKRGRDRDEDNESLSSDTLAVYGRRFAVISTVCPPAPPNNPAAALDMIRLWEPPNLFDDGARAKGREQSSGTEVDDHYNCPVGVAGGCQKPCERLSDAFLKTIRVGYLHERWPTLKADTVKEWRRRYLRATRGNDHTSAAGKEDDGPTQEGDIYWTTKIVGGRSFVTTTDGAIGLAPGWARSGDIVCALLGCKSAILLRRKSIQVDNLDAPQPPLLRHTRPAIDVMLSDYQVVGECYIHGMDDAVGLLGPLPAGYTVQLHKDARGFAQSRFMQPADSPPDPVSAGRENGYANRSQRESGTLEDPRLGPLPRHWRRVAMGGDAYTDDARRSDSPALWEPWENVKTGEMVGVDPRLAPASLRRRGVALEEFHLV